MPSTKESAEQAKKYIADMWNRRGFYIPLTPIFKFIYKKIKQWRE